MMLRNPFLWGLCGFIVIVFGYCLFAGAMSQ